MANPVIRVRMQVMGLKEIRKNTEEAELVAPAFHQAMTEIAAEGLAKAKSAAPVGPSFTGHVGGQTSQLLRSRMQAKPLPLWVRIETTAVRPWPGHGNYSYPKRVEWDKKLHHFKWLETAIMGLTGQAESALKRAASSIEGGWGHTG
jgi:hypothetical protein